MESYLPFIVFPKYRFSPAQPRNVHRILRHRSVEREMRVIEGAEIVNLPRGSRGQFKEIVKYWHTCQFKRAEPRPFYSL